MKKIELLVMSTLVIVFCCSSCVTQPSKHDDSLTYVDKLTPYDMYSIDQPPRVIRSSPPEYPYFAKKDKITGKVVARFIVTKEGKPVNISIVESKPPGVFDKSVLKAINGYKFSPALKNGVPVDVILDLPITITFEK